MICKRAGCLHSQQQHDRPIDACSVRSCRCGEFVKTCSHTDAEIVSEDIAYAMKKRWWRCTTCHDPVIASSVKGTPWVVYPEFVKRTQREFWGDPEPDVGGAANARQVGGEHYGGSAVQHWDIVAMHNLDYFQGQITKYVMRHKQKHGIQDLEKAQHFLEKYIELLRAVEAVVASAEHTTGRIGNDDAIDSSHSFHPPLHADTLRREVAP
jgi:hypothetical protein